MHVNRRTCSGYTWVCYNTICKSQKEFDHLHLTGTDQIKPPKPLKNYSCFPRFTSYLCLNVKKYTIYH